MLVPGALVPALSGADGFFVWLGATTVAGWALAAIPRPRGSPIGGGAARPLPDRPLRASRLPAAPLPGQQAGSGGPPNRERRKATGKASAIRAVSR